MKNMLMRRLLGGTVSFLRSESGMTLPLMAMSLFALIGFTGMAIDTARMQMVQSKLQFSLDAAGLAAGSTVSTANIQTETEKYLSANFNNYMGATVSGVSVTPNGDANTVFTLQATATLNTLFMTAFNIQNVTVSAASQVSRAITGMELVLVLDNTGSMANSAGGGVSKITALKSAATTLVNTLFGGASVSTNGKLWVGIVPFAHAVNIGTSHMSWIGNYNASVNSSWNGCVDARQNGYDVLDTPPSSGSPDTMFNMRSYKKCVTAWNGVVTCSTVASCTPSGSTTCTAKAPYYYSSPLESGVSYGQMTSCAAQITPLTNTSTTLLSSISSMGAVGTTVINQGMVWAWHMLSPNWRGLWGGTMDANGLPLDYNTKGMIKAVVLLTDGENFIDNGTQGSYWYALNKWTGSANATTAEAKLDNKTLQVCNALKAQGVYIYTIALGTDTTTASLALLKSCATADNYYFNSPSTTQLQSVFNTIGDSLSNLRVSK